MKTQRRFAPARGLFNPESVAGLSSTRMLINQLLLWKSFEMDFLSVEAIGLYLIDMAVIEESKK